MLPPSDVSGRSLFLKLTERPAPSEVIPFPRDDENGVPVGQVRIVVWAQEVHDRAREAAVEKLRGKDLRGDQLVTAQGLEDDAVAKELVALTCCEVDPVETADGKTAYRRIFRNGDEVGKALTADEVHVLFTAYMLAKRKWGPSERTMSGDAEVNAWIERLRDGAAALPLLSLLASPQRDDLLLSLVGRACALSRCLSSQPESLPNLLALLPRTWITGTGSASALAASSTPYVSPALELDDVISAAEASKPADSD